MGVRNRGGMGRGDRTAVRGSLGALALLTLTLPLLCVSAARTPQIPRIRVSTRLVQIGVIVRDKNGAVPNLTKDDFAVFDRGSPQQIALFSADGTSPTPRPTGPPPRNTFSDLPQYGATTPRSITIVLLDNLNSLYGSTPESTHENTPYWVEDLALQNAKNHLIEFIKQLQPDDQVAIYGLRDQLHVLADFTSDRDH